MIQKRLVVRGRVQDVNYRELVGAIARRMNILGFNKNMDDGAVEIICQCRDKEHLKEFLDKIKIKKELDLEPNVESIEIHDVKEVKDIGRFFVDYSGVDKDAELLKKMSLGSVSLSAKMDTKFDVLDAKYGSINDSLRELVSIFKDYEVTIKPKKKKK